MGFLQAPRGRDRVAYVSYQVMAYVTGVALAVMTGGLIAKYVFGVAVGGWYAAGWMFHGYAYVIYLAMVVRVTVRERWPLGQMVGVGLAGTIPALGVIVERRLTATRRRAGS